MLTKKIYTFVFRIDWGIFFMVTLWSNSPEHRWGKPRPCRGTRHREQAWGWTGRRTEQRGNSFTSHGTGRGLLVLAEPRKESLETFPSVQATVATQGILALICIWKTRHKELVQESCSTGCCLSETENCIAETIMWSLEAWANNFF